jgi:hypothetical protein
MPDANHRGNQLLHLGKQDRGHHSLVLAENHGYEAVSNYGEILYTPPLKSSNQVLSSGSDRPGIHADTGTVRDIGDRFVETGT